MFKRAVSLQKGETLLVATPHLDDVNAPATAAQKIVNLRRGRSPSGRYNQVEVTLEDGRRMIFRDHQQVWVVR